MGMYFYKHHIIALHEWRRRINPKVTRRDKEFNAPDNVVWLTLEQHTQVHWLLWELNGSRFDEIAWQTLSGKIGKEEACRLATKHANTGKKWTQERKDNHSTKMKGVKHTLTHNMKIGAANSGNIRKDLSERNIASAKEWVVTPPNGLELHITNLNKFCRDNGLDQGNMMAVVRGVMKQNKGWKCRRQITSCSLVGL